MALSVPATQRFRRSLIAGLGGLFARGSGVLATFISIPILIRHLGDQRYGLFATIASLAMVFSFADLGLGNGLVTTVAAAVERNSKGEAKSLVSAGAVVLSGVSLLALAVGLVASQVVNWTASLNLTDPLAANEAPPAFLIFVVVFCLTLPLSLAHKVQLAFQEGHVSAAWQGAGHVVGLGALLLAIALDAQVPALILSWLAGPLITYSAQGIWLFLFQRRWLLPRLKAATFDHIKRLVSLGLSYFVLQLAFAAAFASDNLVISTVLGPEDVTRYTVHAQPFIWVTGLSSVFLIPLWPAYAAALADGDVKWMRLAFRRSLLAAVAVTALAAILLVGFGPRLLAVWVGDSVLPDRVLLGVLGLLAVAMVSGSAISLLLNAAAILRFQVFTALAMGLSAVLAKIFGAATLGLRGVAIGTAATYIIVSLIPTTLYVRWWMKTRIG